MVKLTHDQARAAWQLVPTFSIWPPRLAPNAGIAQLERSERLKYLLGAINALELNLEATIIPTKARWYARANEASFKPTEGGYVFQARVHGCSPGPAITW